MATFSTPHSPLSPMMSRVDTCAPVAAGSPATLGPCALDRAPAPAAATWAHLSDAYHAELDHADRAASSGAMDLLPRYTSDTPLVGDDVDHHQYDHQHHHHGAWRSGGISPSVTPASRPRTAGDASPVMVGGKTSGQPMTSAHLTRQGRQSSPLNRIALVETPVDDFAADDADMDSPNRPITTGPEHRVRAAATLSPLPPPMDHLPKPFVAAMTPLRPPTRCAQVRIPKAAGCGEAGFAALVKALPAGLDKDDYFLRLTDDGAGGTYFVFATRDPDTPVAVFKPAVEEVGAYDNPRGNDGADALDDRFVDGGFVPGEGYRREILAYELDAGHLAGVPQTVAIDLPGKGVGSLQRYCPKMIQSWSTTPAKFDLSSVQAIAVLDIRLLNCDRHGGNLLVPRDDPSLAMIPIDHGFVLPELWADPDFEWSLWPQAKAPVQPAVRAAVAALDADADAAMVEAALGPGPAEVIAVTTRLLQVALADGKSYTLKNVADFCRRPSLTEPAGLERVMAACRQDLDLGGDIDMALVDTALRSAFP